MVEEGQTENRLVMNPPFNLIILRRKTKKLKSVIMVILQNMSGQFHRYQGCYYWLLGRHGDKSQNFVFLNSIQL